MSVKRRSTRQPIVSMSKTRHRASCNKSFLCKRHFQRGSSSNSVRPSIRICLRSVRHKQVVIEKFG
eukprot:6186566-Pleurochrysis_carterae.AAC.1